MKILILAVGKRHDARLDAAITTYVLRLQRVWPLEWQFIPSPHAKLSPHEQKQAEAVGLLKAIRPDDMVVLLDERGIMWDTPQLAAFLDDAQHTAKRLVLVIGGAHGVTAEVAARAHKVWALSKLVFPHQIVRLVVAEQLYRASAILRGEPYHHS